MGRRVIVGGQVVSMVASMAGFPLEQLDASAWSGLFFIIWALGLFTAAGLLALDAAREDDEVAAVGFAAVGLYGVGTTLNSAVLFGAELPPTGGEPSAWPSPVVAVAKLSLWATMVGWILAVRRRPA